MASSRAIVVRLELLEKIWPLVEGWVREALINGKADLASEDVKQHLQRGTMQLWLAWDEAGKRARGCWITEIAESVRGRCCNVVVVSGSGFKHWRFLVASIKAFARLNNCSRLEGGGRDGWLRLVGKDGWRKVRTVIEMRLDDGQQSD